MLTEIAFTPQVFDEELQSDPQVWDEWLTCLGQHLKPVYGPEPLVVSNLYDASWFYVAKQQILSISDHRARVKAQNILTQLKKLLVFRPAANGDHWPEDEQ